VIAAILLAGAWGWCGIRLWAAETLKTAEAAFWKGDIRNSSAGFVRAGEWGFAAFEAKRGLRDALFMALESPRARESQLRASFESSAKRCGRLLAEQVREAPLRAEVWSGVGDFYELIKPENQKGRVYSLEQLSESRESSLEIEELLGIRALQRAVQLDPNAIYQRGEIGRLAWGLGLKAMALEQFTEATTLVSDLERHAFLAEGQVSPEIEKAVVQGMRRAAQPPRNADKETTFRHLGIFLLDQGQYAQAREAFEEAGRGTGTTHFRWQAACEELLGHREQAVTLYRSALAAEAVDAADRVHLLLSEAQILEDMGRHPEAAEAVRAALELDPRNPRGLLLLGRVSEALGSWWEAEDAYVRASEIGSDRIGPLADLVAFYRRSKRPLLALQPARKLVELQPDEPLYRRQVKELQDEIDSSEP
jgi:tetratricopeptide (TPR) repeat protein